MIRCLLSAVMLTFVVGCGSFRKECEGSCADNDDCESGLACVATQTRGSICLPAECAQCANGCNYQLIEEQDEYGATVGRSCPSGVCF